MSTESQIEEVRQIMKDIAFNKVLGLEVEELRDGFCKMKIDYRDDLVGDPVRKALHGGVMSAAMDTAGGAATWTKVYPGRVSTVDLRIDYLRPGEQEDLFIEATVVRLGNRVGVTDMIAYHPGRRQEPIGTGKAVYNIRRSSDVP